MCILEVLVIYSVNTPVSGTGSNFGEYRGKNLYHMDKRTLQASLEKR